MIPDREKILEDFEYVVRKSHGEGWDYVDGLNTEDGFKILQLLKEQEEQKWKWLQNIADNQLSIGGVDPLTEYEQGKWDGLQMAFEILTEERQH